MSDTGPATTEAPRRRGRWFRRSAAALLALVLAWFAFERFVLHVDRYRPRVVEEIEKALGLPVSIGKLDLVLFPTPRLRASPVSVGEGDLLVHMRRVSVHADLGDLLRGEINLTSVELEGLEVTVPRDLATLTEKIESLIENLGESKTGNASQAGLRLQKLSAKKAKLYRHGDQSPLLVLTGSVFDVLSDTITVSLRAALPQYGDAAECRADLTLKRDQATREFTFVAGTGSVAGVELDEALPLEGAPDGHVRARFTVEGTGPAYLGLRVDGEVESGAAAALAGTFSTTVWWDHGILTVNDARWDAPGLRFRADATRHEDGRIACGVPEVSITEEALASLVEMAVFDTFRLASRPGAAFEATDLLLGLGAGRKPRFVQGNVSFRGIDLLLRDGQPITANAHGRLEVEEGLIHLREFAGDGFTLTGSLLPDLDARTVKLDLAGTADLARTRLAAFLPGDAVTRLGGTLSLKRIAGTFTPDFLVPADLVIEAALDEGSVSVATARFDGVFQPVTADFTTDIDGIDTNVTALSDRLGGLLFKGRYTFADRLWSGAVSANLPKVAGHFLGDEAPRRADPAGVADADLNQVLAHYGDSTFETVVRLPSDETRRIDVTASRRGEPPLEAACAFEQKEGTWVLGSIEARTRLPIADLAMFLPPGLEAAGTPTAAFYRHAKEDRFDLRVDLTSCSFAAGKWVEKKSGDRLVLEVTGEASEARWGADTLTVDCLGVRVPFDLTGERIRSRDLNVPVAPLAQLLPEEATAFGTVSGTLVFSPFEADLYLDGVGFTVDPDLAVDSITGGFEVRDGYVTCRDMTIRGANSDCTVTAGVEGDRWRGQVAGEELDLSACMVLVSAVQAFLAEKRPQTPGGPEADPFIGEFSVNVGRLFYHRGRLDDVRALVTFDKDGIHARDLRFIPYTGVATGAFDILPAAGGTRRIDAELHLDAVDVRIFDDLFFQDPRGLEGTLTGTLAFQAPFIAGRDIMKGASGTARWKARDGSFGQLGLATKLLSVLKTTEIISLKLPSLRDKGLTYDLCAGSLAMDQGVLVVREAALESKAYAMEVQGTVDFSREITDATVFVGVLESVNRIIQKVPIVRKVAEVTTERIGVIVHVTGSPYDPLFRVAAGKSIVAVPVEIGEWAFKGVKETIKRIFR